MWRAVLPAIIPAFLVALTSVQTSPYAPKVGQRHADFTLADIATGKPVSLSDFRGKKVLLIQFAAW
jgi:peroxiredoxin